MGSLTAARVLMLIGGIFVALWSLIIVAVAALLSPLLALFTACCAPIVGGILFYVALMVVLAILAIASIVLVWGERPERVRAGSTLGLLTGIVGILTIAGFLIGSLLLIIGGILGLAWKPTTTTAAQPV